LCPSDAAVFSRRLHTVNTFPGGWWHLRRYRNYRSDGVFQTERQVAKKKLIEKKTPNVIYKKEQITRMSLLYLGVYAHSETTKNDELSKFMRTSGAWRYLDYPIIFFRAGYRRHSPFLRFPDYIRCKLKKIIVNNTNEKKKIINISKSAIHNTFPSYSSGYINEVWPETLFNELYKILAKTFRISYMNKYTARLGVNGRGVQLRVRD
jgi:hypothetical protein